MKCVTCGTELKDGCLYCSKCGKEAQIVPDYNILDDDIYMNDFVAKADKNSQKDKEDEMLKRQKEYKQKQKQKKKQKKLIAIVSSVTVIVVVFLIIGISLAIKNSHDHSYDYQIKKADEAYADGQIQLAIDYYSNAISLDKNNLKTRMKLAKIYTDIKDYDSALSLYQEVILIDSLNKDAYEKMISIYEIKKDYDSIIDLSKTVTSAKISVLFEDYKVEAPSFDKTPGSYSDYLQLKITSDKENTIFYTTDGTDPAKSSNVFKDAIELNEEGEYEIKAICVNAKGISSDILQGKYNISIKNPDMPEVSPNGGSFFEKTEVTITVQAGCTAYYTWDSTEPNKLSDKYTGPIVIPSGNNVLSVIVIDDKTGKCSRIFKRIFECYLEEEQ